MSRSKNKKTHNKKVTIRNPFKIRKSMGSISSGLDTVIPDIEIQKSIDEFRNMHEQAKHFEGESAIFKEEIISFALAEYCQRVYQDRSNTFKLLGHESAVNYIVQDSSAGLSEEDINDFEKRWGKKAANELIVEDYTSLRIDADILKKYYSEIVSALQTLPENAIENLFKPMLMKASSNAIEKARKFAKNPEELSELIKQLKIKHYIS